MRMVGRVAMAAAVVCGMALLLVLIVVTFGHTAG